MKANQRRVLIAAGLGLLLAVISYVLEVLFTQAGIAVADTMLDNVLIGILGGALGLAWTTMQAKAESEEYRTAAARQEAKWEERRRLARDIHDTLAQDLAGIILQLEAAANIVEQAPHEARQHLHRVQSLARESLAEARRSVWELRSLGPEGGDLPTAFEHLIRRLTVGTAVKVEFSVQGARLPLPPALEISLLRIGQEALTNVLKHAQASKARIELTYAPREAGLLVEDDGCGFDPQAENAKRGYGLISLREHAANAGGCVTIASQLGGGTRVSALLPICSAGAREAPK